MSMQDLDEAFKLIDENFDEDECIFSSPKSKNIIRMAEEILGLNFPCSYKLFIEKKGFGGPDSIIISGIRADNEKDLLSTGVVWSTLDRRKDLGQPHHLIQIEEIGNGDTYCLDTSQMNADGECPVVVWPIGGYAQTPVLEIVAEDFGAFFLDMVKQQIAYKNSTD